MVTASKALAQFSIAFASIWGALYASGTLEKFIPEWVNSTTQIRSSIPLGATCDEDGNCVMGAFIELVEFEPTDPAVVTGFVIATAILALLLVVTWRGIRAR